LRVLRASPNRCARRPDHQTPQRARPPPHRPARRLRERRSAAREARRARGQSIGRPRKLDEKKAALAQRMHAQGEPASTIAEALGVSRATVYRVIGDRDD